MTTRNLNKTWRDVVFQQYAADLEADVPFPVRYLINIPVVYGLPGRDIWIEIPSKVDLKILKNAILAFMLATRDVGDPTYDGDHITVRPRLPQLESTAQRGVTQYEDDNDDAAEVEPSAGEGTAGI